MIDCEILAFIEEAVIQNSRINASPGFTWGDSGNVKNSYLLNDTVPSNLAGRCSPVTGEIVAIFMTAQTANSGTVSIRRRDGLIFTDLVVVSYSGLRKITIILPQGNRPQIAFNDELTCYVNNIPVRSPVIGLIIRGTI
jgi:hypothetical protein